MDQTSEFWIDVGGTFTDCLFRRQDQTIQLTKTLSSGSFVAFVTGIKEQDITFLMEDEPTASFFEGYTCKFYLGGHLVGHGTVLRHHDKCLQMDGAAPQWSPGMRLELASGEPAPIVAIRRALNLPLSASIPKYKVSLGTTIGTNALLEGKGAPVVFLGTKGLVDMTSIGYQDRPELFNLDIKKSPPLESHSIEVNERIDAKGNIVISLDKGELARIESELGQSDKTNSAIAICLANSWANPEHEHELEKLVRKMRFRHVVSSNEISSLPGYLPRVETTILDAYLAPLVTQYMDKVQAKLGHDNLGLMTSYGGITTPESFRGKDSVLSGPAGGVVALENLHRTNSRPMIGFDMGGTSTDVCRFAGEFERRREFRITNSDGNPGPRITGSTLSIETVAAGGGSVCDFDGVTLTVGPLSAGAHPGPACYGKGGPLTVTDCNVFLQRIDTTAFPFPLDMEAIQLRLTELQEKVFQQTGQNMDLPELARGLTLIAAQIMASPIRQISLKKGYDPSDHQLVVFGGAGGQHACDVAESLGINEIMVPRYASALSAWGIGHGKSQFIESRLIDITLSSDSDLLESTVEELEHSIRQNLGVEQAKDEIDWRYYLETCYEGQEYALQLAVDRPPLNLSEFSSEFTELHRKTFGLVYPERHIRIKTLRIECLVGRNAAEQDLVQDSTVWSRKERSDLVTSPTTAVVVNKGWKVETTGSDALVLRREDLVSMGRQENTALNPVEISLFNGIFSDIAEQMGVTLQRTSASINVRERLDFSCAIFTSSGDLIVNAPHIPVHLGSMGATVRSCLNYFDQIEPGDVFVTNDPFRGGSHLPDVTVITPVFLGSQLMFFTASRAHHAEIGGVVPGSMPPLSSTLAEEGVLIPPFRLKKGCAQDELDLMNHLSSAPFPSRNPEENIRDIQAQRAANELGARLLENLAQQKGGEQVRKAMDAITEAAHIKMRSALKKFAGLNRKFSDQLDDDTPIVVNLRVDNDGSCLLDFTGSGGTHSGNLNCNPGVVRAAVMYCMRCLIGEDIPLNDGVMKPVTIRIPEDSILNPSTKSGFPAVVGGNVETSQRLVDVILGAFNLVAASQGTMNNLTFGSVEASSQQFSYYETICGGAGASVNQPGAHCVQTHMTNTRMTDPETMERTWPVRVVHYGRRYNSGGAGKNPGGDGVVRELLFLDYAIVSVISNRRRTRPWGIDGGEPGLPGNNLVLRKDGTSESLPWSSQFMVAPGDALRLETPGGGGYGIPTK